MESEFSSIIADSQEDFQHHTAEMETIPAIDEIAEGDTIQMNDEVLKEIVVRDHVSESCDSNIIKSPGGHLYWIPDVPELIRPKQWARYPSGEHCKAMYFYYAVQAGFDVRKTTQKKVNGQVTLKYLVCNREGEPNTSSVDTLNQNRSKIKRSRSKIKRRTDMHRRGCPAGIKYRIIPGSTEFEVYEIEERHNHKLYSKHNIHLSRTKRKLDSIQKSFIHKMSYQNVGATKAHRLYAEIQGGYHFRGGNIDDFKNFARDLNCFMGETDAQLLVNRMNDRKKFVPIFSFDLRIENKRMNAIFWADDTSKLHYKEFGDVVSFDATFRTNRYDMVFVPFTGIDNHKRCVTFGAGLLSREDTESYVWLLESFSTAFGKHPTLVLSDQDPTMKKAIEKVFPQSYHRLCMWHITSKLQVKVSWDTYNNSEFKRRFNALVWNSRIEKIQFEQGWKFLMDDFSLNDNKWFKDMFRLRRYWIPAFFKNVPMSGLMRTTSRSESENSSFQQTTNSGTTLNQFMTAFESSMEKQRHFQSVLDFKDVQKFPKLMTTLEIELNASKYYTRRVFIQVQREIYHSLMNCCQKSIISVNGIDTCIVSEEKNDPTGNGDNVDQEAIDGQCEWEANLNDSEYEVKVNQKEMSFTCSCKSYEHFGLLCSHIFCVMKYYKIKDIPSQYVMRRWRKDIIPIEMLRRTFRYGDTNEGTDLLGIDVFSSVDRCFSTLSNDKSKMGEYLKCLKELEARFVGEYSIQDGTQKTEEYERSLGVKSANVIDVQNPSGIRNKGRGTRKRLKSSREIASEKTSKDPRKCAFCGKLVYHDARNCLEKKVDQTDNDSHRKKKEKKKGSNKAAR